MYACNAVPAYEFRRGYYVSTDIFFELWNEEYRDGIRTGGDKIWMALCILKPLNDVRWKFSADHGNTSPPEWLHQGVA